MAQAAGNRGFSGTGVCMVDEASAHAAEASPMDVEPLQQAQQPLELERPVPQLPPEPETAPQQPAHQAQEPAAAPPAGPAGYEPAPSRSKKGRGGGGGGRGQRSGSEPADLVRLSGPIPAGSERLRQGWRPVRLSEEEKAAHIELDESQLRASSQKGYRMVRATHGVHEGTWYFEVTIEDLGQEKKSGAARIGWSTARGELQAPVGYDIWSYAYRSKEGSKVHAGWRDAYGEPYEQGDVIGCLIHLPPGGQPLPTLRERTAEDAVRYKGRAYLVESEGEEKEPDPEARPLPGSIVAFTRNGRLQGKAFTDIREGTYYPALSLYTDSRFFDTARVAVNFGEAPFAHPPPAVEGAPPARPASEMAGPQPEGWVPPARRAGEEDE